MMMMMMMMLTVSIIVIVITITLLQWHLRICGSHLYVREAKTAYAILEIRLHIRFFWMFSEYLEYWEKYKGRQGEIRNGTLNLFTDVP